MKRIFDSLKKFVRKVALPAVLGVLAVDTASAQKFGSGSAVLGTSNSPAYQTNTVYISIPAQYLSLSGGTNANTVFIGAQVLTFGDGSTYAISSYTNPIGTGSFTTNFPAQTIAVNVMTQLQGRTGTNTETVYAP